MSNLDAWGPRTATIDKAARELLETATVTGETFVKCEEHTITPREIADWMLRIKAKEEEDNDE